MSDWSMLVLVSPLLLFVFVTGVVLVIALCRVAPTEVPHVLSVCSTLLCRLADRITCPRQRRRLLDSSRSQVDPETSGNEREGQ